MFVEIDYSVYINEMILFFGNYVNNFFSIFPYTQAFESNIPLEIASDLLEQMEWLNASAQTS